MNKATITVERVREGVSLVTYAKEPVNAAAAEDHLQIAKVFQALGEDRAVRAVVFTAAGERAFISGADLDAKATERARLAALGPRYQVDPGLPVREAFQAVAACPVPVIGAINGPAIGGGLAYAACCDVLLAVERAYFMVGEINVGLLGAVSHLRRLVGSFEARRMYFTGSRMSAAELVATGAVYKVLPNRQALLDAAVELAAEIATKSPIAVRLAKDVFVRMEVEPLLQSYRSEQDYTNRLQGYEDSAEAMNAFLEKREPHWKWR